MNIKHASSHLSFLLSVSRCFMSVVLPPVCLSSVCLRHPLFFPQPPPPPPPASPPLDTNLSALVSHSTCRPPEPVYSTVNKLCDKAPSPRHYSPVECDKSLLHSAPIPNYHLSLFPDSDITRYFTPPPTPTCERHAMLPHHPPVSCLCVFTCSPRLDVCLIKLARRSSLLHFRLCVF